MFKATYKQKGRIETDILAKLDDLTKKLKEATPVRTGKARDGWKREGMSIVNEVEYIDKLNQGSSTQAPAHFIEKTIIQEDFKVNGSIVKNR